MNMASGSCGSGMRPLWAILGGLLALGGIAGIIAGGVLGAKGESMSQLKFIVRLSFFVTPKIN